MSPSNASSKPAVTPAPGQQFVDWFRHTSPYIHAFKDRTFVIAIGGEAVADAGFANLVHDLALLHSLGVRLVLVHGARPQIEAQLQARGAELRYVNGRRVTDAHALACVKEAAGAVRVEIEALLSMGVANSPMAGARIRVASGNVVTARPVGIREGVDYGHTGEVRRIDTEAIRQRLDDRALVLLSPLGYSPTGETFNLTAREVAVATAATLRADKLILLLEGPEPRDTQGALIHELALPEAQTLIQQDELDKRLLAPLQDAVQACSQGVRRSHLISRQTDGALLLELFTRDGLGTMVTADIYEGVRGATVEDVAGIIELIAPLEQEGILVRRSREYLEMEIERFTVVDRDGTIIACAAFYPFADEQVAELACLAVHPDYRERGYGDMLLRRLEAEAASGGIARLFVLTTRAAHWFQERGFMPGQLEDIPVARQQLYNLQRRSKVFIKQL